MEKKELYDKVLDGDYDTKKLLGWINSLPNTRMSPPDKIKKGDVFMHPIYKHPYVFLEKKDDRWLCTTLTSNGEFEEVLCKGNSRFFKDSYIVKILFTVTTPIGSFMGVFDNNTQLNKVTKQLKEIMS